MKKVAKFETKLDIWDAEITVTDKGEEIIVRLPCRKGNHSSWTLGYYFVKVTDKNDMDLLRLAMDTEDGCLITKDETNFFSISEIANGFLTGKGWTVSDFKKGQVMNSK
ncbi:hypothetical protein QG053_10530, partial [Kingella kingae]|uniref:hypothetical protein n=1 Tax=Kingella kingae TaxID=504 RepID=UPI00254D0BE9